MSNQEQRQTTTYNGEEYTIPSQARWTVQSRDDSKNRIRAGPEAHSENRARVKATLQGHEVRIDDVPVGRIDATGCFYARLARKQVSPDGFGDIQDVADRNTFDSSVFQEGADLYKTAEDDVVVYLTTTEPPNFSHEEPQLVDDDDEQDDSAYTATADWTDAEAAAGSSDDVFGEPAVRVGAQDTIDDLKVGERYYAEVNNTKADIGAWVSLPDTDQNHLTGLAHRRHHGTDLSRLKTHDTVHVALRSIDTEDRLGFIILDGIDTMNDIDFPDTAPEELVYLDEDNNPIQTPDVDAKVWATTKTPEEANAEFNAIPDAPDIKTMSTDEFLDHLEHTSVPETFIDALEDQPDNFAADADEVRRIYEMRHTEGSLAHTFAATDGGTADYTDLGTVADDADVSITEAAAPDITEHYADSAALKENAQAIFQSLRQSGVDVDPADYIRQKFAELDEDQQHEFISWAANSEIPDSLFRKLTRELL